MQSFWMQTQESSPAALSCHLEKPESEELISCIHVILPMHPKLMSYIKLLLSTSFWPTSVKSWEFQPSSWPPPAMYTVNTSCIRCIHFQKETEPIMNTSNKIGKIFSKLEVILKQIIEDSRTKTKDIVKQVRTTSSQDWRRTWNRHRILLAGTW